MRKPSGGGTTILHSGTLTKDRPLEPLLRALRPPLRLVLHGYVAPEIHAEIDRSGAEVELVAALRLGGRGPPDRGRRRRARHAGARGGRRDRGRREGLRVPRARQAGALITDGGATEALLRRLGADQLAARLDDPSSIEAALAKIGSGDLPPPVPPEKLAPYERAAPSPAPGRAARRARLATAPSTSTIRSDALPSQSGGILVSFARAASSSAGTSAIRAGSRPSSVFVPIETVIGRSVFARSVKHGSAEVRRLLLDPARVGEHARRAGDEAQELDVADAARAAAAGRGRGRSPAPRARRASAGAPGRRPAAASDNAASCAHRLRQQRAVDERRPVQRDDEVLAALEPVRLRRAGVLDPLPHRDERVDHRVADVVDRRSPGSPRRAGCRAPRASG